MTKMKLFEEGFKTIKSVDLSNPNAVIEALNEFVSKFSLGSVPNISHDVDVPNKSEPAFDTLDFDEILSHFNSPE